MSAITLGVLFGNRDFFPDHLITEGRKEILAALERAGIRPILLGESDTKLGAVETYADARRCAELFRRHRDEIDGVLITLPNFGDEKGAAETLKLARLNVPVLVHAFPDALHLLDAARRRDAYCGKLSVCNNLRQAGIPYSLTRQHVVKPSAPEFARDLDRFAAVCRVVRGLRSLRVGAVGARPNAFNTVRYSEKILEANGISVSTIDLSEVFGKATALAADNAKLTEKIDEIHAYARTDRVPAEAIDRMGRLAVVLDDWMTENDLQATAIQCWTSIQENFGICPCTVMSMMSEKLLPSACEVDITGLVTMYAFQQASLRPSALVDWNNNYGSEADKCVLFHCGNWAKSFLEDVEVSTAPILGTVVGEVRTFGALAGAAKASPITYGRVSTDDTRGVMRAYVGEGRLTDDPLDTFGNRAVAEVPRLQRLMRRLCRDGFEHHAVINRSETAAALEEAFVTYLGWETYRHGDEDDD